MSQRESMEFDIVIVGAGPAGLATACHIKQLCLTHKVELSVCLIEKGSEIGAHIVSGAIIDPSSLTELFPDWKNLGAPLNSPVTKEEFHFLTSATGAFKLPDFMLPKSLNNHGNYVASLGNLCRWLGEQAETLGVEVFAGFSAAEVLYNEDGSVRGIATGDMGLSKQGEEKASFEAGYELLAKYTVFAEGCRGHLGKQLIKRFNLDQNKTPQHYALGIKELWEVPAEYHQPGKVLHGLGWPLGFGSTTGGWFCYHLENSQIAIGLITDLNYQNPWLSPFDEFQSLKHHPLFKPMLTGSRRVSYGARALVKGGLQSLPKLTFPGGLLVGDEAGFLNFVKIKGSHAAIKSGMLAAESILDAFNKESSINTGSTDNKEMVNHSSTTNKLSSYEQKFEKSWLYQELYLARNCAPAFHKFGTLFGSCFNFIDQKIFSGRLPFTLHDKTPDHESLSLIKDSKKIEYSKADNVISFDKLSSVFLSNTNHEEDQPCHLQLQDSTIPLNYNLSNFAEPAQRYCPAGVYEIIKDEQGDAFQINAQNCVHCKTCDIKDPMQNIQWVAPEGSGGPNYPNM